MNDAGCYLCNDVAEFEQSTTVCETCYSELEEENKNLVKENKKLKEELLLIQNNSLE